MFYVTSQKLSFHRQQTLACSNQESNIINSFQCLYLNQTNLGTSDLLEVLRSENAPNIVW